MFATDRAATARHQLPSGRVPSGHGEEHAAQGVPLRVYSPAKTVADLFKDRHKLGRDVAREALRDAAGRRWTTWRYAGVCRVARVMAPYLETLP